MRSVIAVIPYLTQLWCLEDCVNSFGESNIPVLIIDNSEHNDLKDIPFAPNIEVVHFGKNIGVSAAWNLALNRGYDQTLIISQWVRFAPAELEWRKKKPWGLTHVAEGIDRYATDYGLEFADQGYHCISIGQKTIDMVGLFDENLTPMAQDDDYQKRRDIVGIKGLMNCWGDYEESGVLSIAFGIHKKGGVYDNIPTFYRSAEYYNSKWCSVPFDWPGDYTRPFNDFTKGVDYWPKAGEPYSVLEVEVPVNG